MFNDPQSNERQPASAPSCSSNVVTLLKLFSFKSISKRHPSPHVKKNYFSACASWYLAVLRFRGDGRGTKHSSAPQGVRTTEKVKQTKLKYPWDSLASQCSGPKISPTVAWWLIQLNQLSALSCRNKSYCCQMDCWSLKSSPVCTYLIITGPVRGTTWPQQGHL